jgi:hypothetical protein
METNEQFNAWEGSRGDGRKEDNSSRSGVFSCVAAAFFLRVTGLYDNFHTDEQAVMTPVERMSKAYSFDPDFYKRPNHSRYT